MAIRHTHAHRFQTVVRGINICVTLRLRQMDGHGVFHFLKVPEHTLDFIYGDPDLLHRLCL